MSTNPRISIVLPAYNAAPYLRQALASMRWQTFQDWECVCVNDGSSDATREIIKQFAAADPRFRLIDQANAGIVSELNNGIHAARAEWIARMDGDDVALPDRLAVQYQFVSENRACVVVGSDVLCVDPDGLPIVPIRFAVEHDEIERRLLAGADGSLAHPTVLMRRDAVLGAGLYRHQYEWVEDLDLWLRLVRVGRMANIPQVLLHYRQHQASVCASRQSLQRQRKQDLLCEAHEVRDLSLPEMRAPRRPASRRQRSPVCKWARRAARSGYYRTAWSNWRRQVRTEPFSLFTAWETCEIAVRVAGSLLHRRRLPVYESPDWRLWDCTAEAINEAIRKVA